MGDLSSSGSRSGVLSGLQRILALPLLYSVFSPLSFVLTSDVPSSPFLLRWSQNGVVSEERRVTTYLRLPVESPSVLPFESSYVLFESLGVPTFPQRLTFSHSPSRRTDRKRIAVYQSINFG